MINRILIELYEEYSKSYDIEVFEEFANKTFNSEGVRKLFVGSMLILVDRSTNSFKPKYEFTRENLEDIVRLASESVGNTNLMAFYIDRVNTGKGVTKYLNDLVRDENIGNYADILLKYLEQFKPDLVNGLKNNKNLDDYLK